MHPLDLLTPILVHNYTLIYLAQISPQRSDYMVGKDRIWETRHKFLFWSSNQPLTALWELIVGAQNKPSIYLPLFSVLH